MPAAIPYVVVATPCPSGMVSQSYMVSILKLMDHCVSAPFRISVALLGHDALITRSRSALLAAFLDQPAASHILFIDPDVGFEPQQVGRMVAFDQDLVGALYPAKMLDWDRIGRSLGRGNEPLRTAGLHYVGTPCEGDALEIENGFATAEAVGGGFMLVSRKAVERLVAAYPETRYRACHAVRTHADHTSVDFASVHASDNLYALFDCFIDPDTGTHLGEDAAFCRRWRALGGRIWLDLESRLVQVGPYLFAGDTGPRYADPAALLAQRATE